MTNTNNPYARPVPLNEREPADRPVQDHENVRGAPNPKTVAKKGSDGDVMSGLQDATGENLTVAQASATLNNNALAAAQPNQPEHVQRRVVDDKEIPVPANTPAV